jgi:hypothetical protein
MRACGLVPTATARGKLGLFVCDLDDVTAERACLLRSQGVRVATEQAFLTMLTDLESRGSETYPARPGIGAVDPTTDDHPGLTPRPR